MDQKKMLMDWWNMAINCLIFEKGDPAIVENY